MSERAPVTNFSASWTRVDQTSDPSFYASLLDATRAEGLAEARRDPGTAFAPLKLRAGLRVLDVGCGTGDYLRIMAPLVAPGPAVGVDLSTTLIARAQRRAAPGQAHVSPLEVPSSRVSGWEAGPMDGAVSGASRLPQLHGRPMVTDGGMETDLIFHHGIDLPHFAAFPLLESACGQALLADYYDGYAAIARRAGAGLVLESPTWRANPEWGSRLGYSAAELTRANTSAIALLARLRERYEATVTGIVVSGMVGPQGDGYQPGQSPSADEAAAYHRPQIDAFAQAGADMVSALTLTSTGEAIGIVRAARAAGLPVTISFTVEIDGRLPGGLSLAQAITDVDDAAGPDYFMVNCAHPTHIEPALAEPGPWRERLAGVRYNASAKSHAELDQATELDDGSPRLLAAAHAQLSPLLPRLSVVGGCCGTDARHVAALWRADHTADL